MEEKKENMSGLFRTADTVTENFGKLRFITLTCVIGMVLCVVGCVFYSSSFVKSFGDNIYVIDKGVAMSATRSNSLVTRPDEIKEQSRKLHTLLFSVTPNKEMVEHNIDQALKFSDKSVWSYTKDIDEKKFYSRIAQAGAVQEIIVDSVKTDVSRYPYPVVTYARLFLTRQSSVTVYSLISRCRMTEATRNPDNLNGLVVEAFEVVQNKELETRRR